MKRTKIMISISVIVVAALAMGAVAAEDAAKDKPGQGWAEQKVIDRHLGNWQGTTIVHKAKWHPKETRGTDTSSCVRILGGLFTLNKSEGSDGSTSISLTTYDREWKCYRLWWFHSGGAVAHSQGKWDAKTRTMTWHGEGDDGVTSVGKVQYLDDNTVKWSSVAKDAKGDIGSHVEGKSKRVKQLPKRKATPAAKPAERSAEQKVLDLWVGNWKSTFTPAKSPENPKGIRWTGTASIVRILGGRFIQDSTKASDGRPSLFLTTYDVRLKYYRTWLFTSRGFAMEYRGKWDAKTRTLTMVSDHNGFTTTTKTRAVDNDAWESSMVTKDGDGKTVFQGKGKHTRVK